MIRLSLLRFAIAVSKTAINISDLLKPATWKKIAIAHGLLGLSLLAMYGFLERSTAAITIPPVDIATVEPISRTNSVTDLKVVVLIKPSDSSAISHFGAQDLWWAETGSVADQWDGTTRTTMTSSYLAGKGFELSSIGDTLPSAWRFPSIGAPTHPLALPPAPADPQSLLEMVLKLFPLFQGIAMMINAGLASILALLAHQRNKADMALKQLDMELRRLQILQIQRQLDKDGRERLKEFEEATRSRIVLIS